MRLNSRTILALVLAAGTALALAAPAASQAATITRVVIYKGGGNKTPVGPAGLPTVGNIGTSTVPKTITATGAGKLKMDVASLERPWGACAKKCSEWWFYHNGAVQVTSFSWVKSTGTQTAHALASVPVNSAWKSLGNGVWTPLYLTWQAGSAATLHCIHLSTSTYDWKNVADPAANCP